MVEFDGSRHCGVLAGQQCPPTRHGIALREAPRIADEAGQRANPLGLARGLFTPLMRSSVQ
jgi:hypothetical protein